MLIVEDGGGVGITCRFFDGVGIGLASGRERFRWAILHTVETIRFVDIKPDYWAMEILCESRISVRCTRRGTACI